LASGIICGRQQGIEKFENQKSCFKKQKPVNNLCCVGYNNFKKSANEWGIFILMSIEIFWWFRPLSME